MKNKRQHQHYIRKIKQSIGHDKTDAYLYEYYNTRGHMPALPSKLMAQVKRFYYVNRLNEDQSANNRLEEQLLKLI